MGLITSGGPLRGCGLFLPSLGELRNHLLLHDVDQTLLLLEALARDVNVLLQEFVLFQVQVTIFALLEQLLVLFFCALLSPLHLVLDSKS